ncbi:hypothetical protein [Corynebacterium sp. 11A]|uniref:hypothetical protein n=1 Tax=Corynebacterium sp. 11A TaxID=2080510 RepID=UPI00178C2E7D|nr:hypothetical protein [Corynebacterium sp. 11A]
MAKRWLSYEQQVELLEQRGMRIDDKAAAAQFLARGIAQPARYGDMPHGILIG